MLFFRVLVLSWLLGSVSELDLSDEVEIEYTLHLLFYWSDTVTEIPGQISSQATKTKRQAKGH